MAVDALVLFPVSGIRPGQAAQRQQPPHEADVRISVTGSDQGINLVEHSEVVPRLGRGVYGWIMADNLKTRCRLSF